MTVKELINELSQYPDDMEVVYDAFEEDDSFNFISGAYADEGIEEVRLHLYEE